MWSGRSDASAGEAAATAGEDEAAAAPAGWPYPTSGAAGGPRSANIQPAPQQQRQQPPLPLAQRSSRDPRLQAGRAVAAGAATASPGSAVPAATAATAQPSPAIAAAGGSASAAAGSWLGMSDKQPAEPQQGEAARDSQQEEGTEGDLQQHHHWWQELAQAPHHPCFAVPCMRRICTHTQGAPARQARVGAPGAEPPSGATRAAAVPAVRLGQPCPQVVCLSGLVPAPGHWRGVAMQALPTQGLQAAQPPAAARDRKWRPLWEQQR